MNAVAIVPVAIPLLAGPGAVATVRVLMSPGTGVPSAIPVALSVVLTFAAAYLILRGAMLVQRVLRQTGVAILERVMGLLLAAIAVQFIAEGDAPSWPRLDPEQPFRACATSGGTARPSPWDPPRQ